MGILTFHLVFSSIKIWNITYYGVYLCSKSNDMNKEKQTLFVTEQELLSVCMEWGNTYIPKSDLINVVLSTTPKMNKTGNPYFGGVEKHSSSNYKLLRNYEKRVITNGENEGISKEENPFEVEKPKGKHHVSPCVLQSDKDENVYYLNLEWFEEVKPRSEYFFNGEPIERELLEDFLPKKSENTKQPQDREVFVITPLFSSIVSLTIEGTKYVVQR